MRKAVARAGVGFALFLGGLGPFVTFFPGAQAGWYGTAAAGAMVGLIAPGRRARAVAAALALGLAWLAWEGYREGLRYREWQQSHAIRLAARPAGPAHRAG